MFPRGYLGCVRVLGTLRESDLTTRQIAEAAGGEVAIVQKILRYFRHYRVIHIARWERVPPNQTCVAVYRLGDGADAPSPPPIYAGSRSSARLRENLPPPMAEVSTFVSLWGAMHQPQTVTELVATTGWHRLTVTRAVNALRAAGIAHVGAWEQRDPSSPGAPMAAWKRGPGRRAERPKRQSRKEANAQYQSRRKAREMQREALSSGPMQHVAALLSNPAILTTMQGLSGRTTDCRV